MECENANAMHCWQHDFILPKVRRGSNPRTRSVSGILRKSPTLTMGFGLRPLRGNEDLSLLQTRCCKTVASRVISSSSLLSRGKLTFTVTKLSKRCDGRRSKRRKEDAMMVLEGVCVLSDSSQEAAANSKSNRNSDSSVSSTGRSVSLWRRNSAIPQDSSV